MTLLSFSTPTLTNISDEVLGSMSRIHKVLAVVIVWVKTLGTLTRQHTTLTLTSTKMVLKRELEGGNDPTIPTNVFLDWRMVYLKEGTGVLVLDLFIWVTIIRL